MSSVQAPSPVFHQDQPKTLCQKLTGFWYPAHRVHHLHPKDVQAWTGEMLQSIHSSALTAMKPLAMEALPESCLQDIRWKQLWSLPPELLHSIWSKLTPEQVFFVLTEGELSVPEKQVLINGMEVEQRADLERRCEREILSERPASKTFCILLHLLDPQSPHLQRHLKELSHRGPVWGEVIPHLEPEKIAKLMVVAEPDDVFKLMEERLNPDLRGKVFEQLPPSIREPVESAYYADLTWTQLTQWSQEEVEALTPSQADALNPFSVIQAWKGRPLWTALSKMSDRAFSRILGPSSGWQAPGTKPTFLLPKKRAAVPAHRFGIFNRPGLIEAPRGGPRSRCLEVYDWPASRLNLICPTLLGEFLCLDELEDSSANLERNRLLIQSLDPSLIPGLLKWEFHHCWTWGKEADLDRQIAVGMTEDQVEELWKWALRFKGRLPEGFDKWCPPRVNPYVWLCLSSYRWTPEETAGIRQTLKERGRRGRESRFI